MPDWVPFVVAGLVAGALIAASVRAQRRRDRVRKAAVEKLGFSSCPDRKSWLEETLAGIQNTRGLRCEVRAPKRLAGASPIYYYVKIRRRDAHEEAIAEEEILFALKRPAVAGLVLIVKPSSLAPGLATRILGALATGPWDVQPDDLRRLEIPPELRETNLVGALGPPGSGLYDLVDARTLGVVQGLGDAGGTFVRFRDAWCSVAGASRQIPFRVDELLARIRPLL
jgi:hypothetical protein